MAVNMPKINMEMQSTGGLQSNLDAVEYVDE